MEIRLVEARIDKGGQTDEYDEANRRFFVTRGTRLKHATFISCRQVDWYTSKC
jgi:hypothetical protein